MELLFLGTGTGLPSASRGSPAILLRSLDVHLLLDIGPGTLRQLQVAGIPFWRIELVLITHFHPDHINGLSHLLFALRSPAIAKESRPIKILGPKGLLEAHRSLSCIYGKWVEPIHQDSTLLEVEPDTTITHKHLEITSTNTMHTPNSLAFRIRGEGRSVVYSGDSGYSERLSEFAHLVDLLILECSFPDPHEGHLTPYEAGVLAKRAGAKRLVLTHFYPEVLETDITSEVRRAFDGELTLGRDMMRLILS